MVLIHKVIANHQPTIDLFLESLTVDQRTTIADSVPALTDLILRLLTAYHRMRGRDFVKHVMSKIKSVAAADNRTALRDGLAAAASTAAKTRSKASVGRKRDRAAASAGSVSGVDYSSILEELEEEAAEEYEDLWKEGLCT